MIPLMEWILTGGPVPYETAIETMQARVAAIRDGSAAEAVWLLEHPPLYTAGTSAKATDLRHAQFPVFETGRGGQYTYHGPGQRVAYVMLDLQQRAKGQAPDIRKYVWQLEEWIIRTLARFDIIGERREGRIGIWVCSGSEAAAQKKDSSSEMLVQENKIAAIGVRVSRGVTWHGISINVAPDLSHYSGIVPCGINEFGVTSFAALGKRTDMAMLDQALRQEFSTVFPDQCPGARLPR